MGAMNRVPTRHRSGRRKLVLLPCFYFPISLSPLPPFPFFLFVPFSFHLTFKLLTFLIDKDKIFSQPSRLPITIIKEGQIMPRILIVILTLAILIPLSACEQTPEQKFVEAAKLGDADSVESCLAAGMNVNAADREGRTALMEAASHSQFEIVKTLLAKGADVNVKDKQGKTALMYAAWRGQTDIAHVLMAKDADMNAKDNEGETALAIALKTNQKDMVEMLKEAGAKE